MRTSIVSWKNLIFILSFLALTLIASGQVPSSVDPVDNEAELPGRRLFVDNCLICHSEEMTSYQRLTSKQWTAEIDKMVGWGAPLPLEKKPDLLEYLKKSFSDKTIQAKVETTLPTARLAVTNPSKSLGAPARGRELFTKLCATCHGINGQGGDLGTNLIEREILANDNAYHETVRKGVRRMPGFVNVLKATDETDLLAWLRSRR